MSSQTQKPLRKRLADDAGILNNLAVNEDMERGEYFDMMDRQQVESCVRDVLDETDSGTLTLINHKMYQLTFEDPSPVIDRLRASSRTQTGGEDNLSALVPLLSDKPGIVLHLDN